MSETRNGRRTASACVWRDGNGSGCAFGIPPPEKRREQKEAGVMRNGKMGLSGSRGGPWMNAPGLRRQSLSQRASARPANCSRRTRSRSLSTSTSRALNTNPVRGNAPSIGGSDVLHSENNSIPDVVTSSPCRETSIRAKSTTLSPSKSATAHKAPDVSDRNGQTGATCPAPASAVPAERTANRMGRRAAQGRGNQRKNSHNSPRLARSGSFWLSTRESPSPKFTTRRAGGTSLCAAKLRDPRRGDAAFNEPFPSRSK